MTLKELQQIADILQWAKGKVMSESVFDKIAESHEVVKREIKLKTMDPRKSDVSGNVMDGD